MKNLLLIVLGLSPLLPAPFSALQPPAHVATCAAKPDSTTVRVLYGAAEPELNELLSRVLRIEKHRLALHDPRLAGRLFHLTYQEFRLGKAGPEQELVGQPARLLQFDTTGTFACTVYARQAGENKVETSFLFRGGATTKTFEAVTGRANEYSLRTDIQRLRPAADQAGRRSTSPAEEFRLPIGPKVPLLVYTLPYEADGWLLYCSLAQSQVPVGAWYQRFKIPHFVVYYVRVE